MSEAVFWTSLAIILYTYLGFPIVTWIRSLLCARSFKTGDITPSVSFLIAAHNEEDSIGEKVRNVLDLDYPAERLQIVVVSDGSTDRTIDILNTFDDPRVVVLDLPRGGKAAALNCGEKHCTGDILIFSDANSMFTKNTLRALVKPFADATVGGVAGDQRYSKTGSRSATDAGERSYWNFDRLMKLWQSRAGNVTSATGAIYAIRHPLFRTVPEGVTDDFVTSTQVIAQGYRLVFAVDAAAYEPVAGSTGIEFGRKVRIITRGLRGVLERRTLLNPFRFGFYSIQLFSHKVLRRQMVYPLLALLVTSLLLAGTSAFYAVSAAGQLFVYSAALLGWLLNGTRAGRKKPLAIPFFFCLVNCACLLATFHSLAGRRVVIWNPQRTKHPESSVAALVKG
jgi:cellulose synthase/poly-beta-1,6-N-acetylglucosamine synthase-like glycosyltransferase